MNGQQTDPTPLSNPLATPPANSPWPPEVAALGTPERVYRANPTLELLGWCAVFGLFAIAALFGIAIVKPFGHNPPPPGVAFAGFLLCGLGSLAMLAGVIHLRGYCWLVFPAALVELHASHSVIVPWSQIIRVETVPNPVSPRYLVVRQVGRHLELNFTLQEVESLRALIEQYLQAPGPAGAQTSGVLGSGVPANGGLVPPVESSPSTATNATTQSGNAPAPQGKSTGFWPAMHDMESARQVARQGTVAAALCAGMTTLAVMLSAAGVHLLNINTDALVDAFIFGVIALGIARMSRLAAVAGLALYLIERAATWNSMGFAPSLVYLVIFTNLFINGVRGTFAFHRFKDAQGPGPLPYDPAFMTPQMVPPIPDPHGAAPASAPAYQTPPATMPDPALQPSGYAPSPDVAPPADAATPAAYSPYDPNLPIYNPSLRQSQPWSAPVPSKSPLVSPLILVVVAVYLGAMLFYAVFSGWMSHRYGQPAANQFQQVNTALNAAAAH
ncbi:MAG: hypothetical protein JO316_01000 [Abitibacteriaceae bacterium]|nr:hypothetical protein [Abditibacteriaceae bacterium]